MINKNAASVHGMLIAIVLGGITTAALAWVCIESTKQVPPNIPFTLGVAQTIVYVITSFTRMIVTL